jgi:hypothetical protein
MSRLEETKELDHTTRGVDIQHAQGMVLYNIAVSLAEIVDLLRERK